jgi:hypothetical protein
VDCHRAMIISWVDIRRSRTLRPVCDHGCVGAGAGSRSPVAAPMIRSIGCPWSRQRPWTPDTGRSARRSRADGRNRRSSSDHFPLIATSSPGWRPRQIRQHARRAARIPTPLITPQIPRGWPAGEDGTTASQVAPTPAVVSSGTGVPPRRGRPPEQPHDSVVHPTQPPPEGDRVEVNRREHDRSRGLVGERRVARAGNGAPTKGPAPGRTPRGRVPRNAPRPRR